MNDKTKSNQKRAGFAPGVTTRLPVGDASSHDSQSHRDCFPKELFVTGPVIVFRWRNTPGLHAECVSPNIRAVLGYADSDFISGAVPYTDIIHPEDVGRITQDLAECGLAAIGHIDHEPYRLLKKAGGIVWVLNHTTIIRNEAGEVTHYLGYLVDITQMRKAEESRRISEDRLDMVLKGGDLGLWDWDLPSGKAVYNARWAEMLGYGLGDIRPHIDAWRQLVHPEDLPQVEKALADHIKGTSSAYHSEHRLLHKSGSWVWVENMGKVLVRDAQGGAIRFAGTQQDISVRRSRTEQALAQERFAAVGRLAGGIAHDFNNILTSILGFAQLLKRSPQTPPSMLRGLEVIEGSSTRAAGLVRQLLDFSRKSITSPQRLDLVPFAHEMADMLRRTLSENITVLVSTDGGKEHPVYADPSQLQEVIINLGINARDAMPSGGFLVISVSGTDEPGSRVCVLSGRPITGKYVRLAMKDSGKGIDSTILPKIFEPFFTTKPHGEGSGLGLAQVAGIVAQHRGCIVAQTSTKSGTEFAIYLPPCAEPATPTERPPRSTEIVHGYGETILLVEDNDLVRDAIGETLKELNYNVIAVSSGEEALSAHLKHRRDIALVLSDMVMPGIDGGQLFDALKERDANIRFIVMSGYTLAEAGADLLKRGAAAWLEKPMSLSRLSQVISSAMDNKLI